ncbi:MAG: PD-(D/E)XK nuclease family protein, partial [Clostridia bacterium]|nr:PD-(D/E)XK nuclease family protein [Clostridia bacterium]
SMHLIFSGKEDGRKNIFNGANACVDFLPSFIPAKLHTVEEIELSRRNADFKEVLIGVAEKDKVDGIKSCINYDYPFMQDCTLPLKGSVTALTKDDEENNYTRVLFEDESTDSQKGTIAHKLLENFNFDESIIKTAERLITLGVLSREEVDKINLERIDRAINSDALKGLKGKKLYREQPFLVNIPANKVFDTDSDTSVLVQGVIDLLAVGDGGAEIIDYKYSSLNAESMQKRYRDQVNLYAYAAETVLNIKVIKKTLVNIFTGEVAIIQ